MQPALSFLSHSITPKLACIETRPLSVCVCECVFVCAHYGQIFACTHRGIGNDAKQRIGHQSDKRQEEQEKRKTQ